MTTCCHELGDRRGRVANLSIELTTRCNSACTHCFTRAHFAEEASLGLDLVKAIAREGYDEGYRHLHLTGGEPLLWPGFLDLLEDVFAQGYQTVFLNTNGLLMTNAVALALARYPRLAISVSLQGPASLHDRMRGKGAYRQASRGISAALDAGLTVTLFAATGKTLLAQLPAFAATVHEKFHGIEQLTLIQLIRVKDDRFDPTDELLVPDDFIRLVRTVSALNLYGLKTDVLYNPLVNAAASLLRLPMVPRSSPLCRSGKLMIRANRDMTFAHSTRQLFGKYAPGMIGKVLASDRYRAAVAPDDILCPTCRFEDECRKAGMMRPAIGERDMGADVPYCQRVLAGIAPACGPAAN